MREPARPIVLVGLMGSGKSTVGKRVARRLDRPFVDTDDAIEAATGSTVAALFAERGEDAFRALETEALRAQLLADPAPVVATGGGAVVREVNRELLRDGATVVWLDAAPAMLVHRIRPDGSRPLLADDPLAALERLAAERSPWYAEVADHVVPVDHVDARAVTEAVLAALGAATPAPSGGRR